MGTKTDCILDNSSHLHERKSNVKMQLLQGATIFSTCKMCQFGTYSSITGFSYGSCVLTSSANKKVLLSCWLAIAYGCSMFRFN